MFTYYQEITSSEHMLFAKEIGALYNVSGQKASKVIDAYCTRNGISAEPKLFYKTKYGLSRVYPRAIYKPAMEELKAASRKSWGVICVSCGVILFYTLSKKYLNVHLPHLGWGQVKANAPHHPSHPQHNASLL